MDILFRIAIALLPFDNWFFAPSYGWATVTPIIFFIYLLFNYKYLKTVLNKYSKLLFLLLVAVILSIIAYLIVGYNFNALFDTIKTIILGLSTLFSIDIYFSQKKNNIDSILKILFWAYLFSLILGWIEFFTYKYSITIIQNILNSLFKRNNYLIYGRIQFSFTEPSFIGMHIFGVLLPLYLVSKNKKIKYLIIAFIFSTIFFNSSTRFLIDTIIILATLSFYYLIKNKKYYLTIFIIIFIALLFGFSYTKNERVKRIVDNGIYADNSLASRYFRIQTSIYGYKYDYYNFLFGYGMGNSIIPMRKGYDEALEKYTSNYLEEINMINQESYYDSNASFCLYTRIINEYGIIFLIVLIIAWISTIKKSDFRYKYLLLFIIAYLYLQFDSYAFYTLWIYLFIIKKWRYSNENSTN